MLFAKNYLLSLLLLMRGFFMVVQCYKLSYVNRYHMFHPVSCLLKYIFYLTNFSKHATCVCWQSPDIGRLYITLYFLCKMFHPFICMQNVQITHKYSSSFLVWKDLQIFWLLFFACANIVANIIHLHEHTWLNIRA